MKRNFRKIDLGVLSNFGSLSTKELLCVNYLILGFYHLPDILPIIYHLCFIICFCLYMTNLEKIIFSKEWSMFFNIPKIKIIDNLFIVSCLLLKHFDKKELKKERNKKSGLGKCFFPLLLCSLLCVVFSFNRLTLYN